MRSIAGAATVVVVGVVVGMLVAPGSSHTSPLHAHAQVRGTASGDAKLVAALPAPAKGFSIPKPHELSDTRYDTRWAPLLGATPAYARPDSHSPVVAEVAAQTPEGTTDIVDAEREVSRDGEDWVKAQVAALPDGTTGWIPRSRLGGWTFVDTHLVVDTEGLKLTLYRDGSPIFTTPIGVGAAGTGTPTGNFYVRDELTRYASPEYGPVAFGTSARSSHETDWPAGGFIGIHGTDSPQLIPGRVSHGCIRLRNAAITRLARLMPVGTPVTIR